MTDRLVSYDPRTRQPVGEVAVTSPAEMPAVVERSRKAFEVWSALPFSERKRLLIAFKKTVLARGEEIAEVVSAETGKPVVDAYPLDVLTALSVIDHYARKAHKYLKTTPGRHLALHQHEGLDDLPTPWCRRSDLALELPLLPLHDPHRHRPGRWLFRRAQALGEDSPDRAAHR
jgi:acyl-CoA reductase-like NAD-dependent aldehyde dehydrogenase